MKWTTERDFLIAETMAFVQSVTGKKPEARLQVELSLSSSIDKLEPLQSPVEASVTPRKIPAIRSAFREEIEGRVAAFRAHQHRFDRERDRHFNSVLTGIRAAITAPPKASPP